MAEERFAASPTRLQGCVVPEQARRPEERRTQSDTKHRNPTEGVKSSQVPVGESSRPHTHSCRSRQHPSPEIQLAAGNMFSFSQKP